ncbi:MAG: adenylate/guanylate cyclase domain-containing response regulator [Bdellovibrio sp.]|nr:MAG: adenylate/guanylate cyclase domain-containing response regulator [Bdellovibrio sp.]
MSQKTSFNLEALEALEQEEEKKSKDNKYGSILCVDDEPSNLSALKNFLEDEFEVYLAESASQAMKILDGKKVDVIITDQRMPEKLGTEFLNDLIEKDITNNARIILTGYADVDVLVECINKGLIDRYLLKPWKPDELKATVRQALEKIKTQRTLKKLLPDKVIEKLYPEGWTDVDAGYGKEIQASVLFTDIRKFTALTEEMKVTDTFKLISSFFDHIAPLVKSYHGFIDKYLGDGIMAIFDDEESSPTKCIQCAIEMAKETVAYNKKHRSGPAPAFRKDKSPRKPLNIGMGIHYGKLVLGTVGFDDRIDVTVLGDTANTAARIQNLTSYFDVSIILSDEVVQYLDKDIKKRYLGKIQLKGKTQKIKLWEIFEVDNEDLIKQKEDAMEKYLEAVKEYEDGDAEKAKELFQKLYQKYPQDTVIKYFATSSAKRPPHLFSRKEDV